MRRSFERVITRAVGPIPEILHVSGQRGGEEWESAGPLLKGKFKLADRSEFTLPYGGQSRVILAVEKT